MENLLDLQDQCRKDLRAQGDDSAECDYQPTHEEWQEKHRNQAWAGQWQAEPALEPESW